jgi:2-polyprenyl-6-methoxyphenol hydroxylase-like FAD-dependent oxidoreductase
MTTINEVTVIGAGLGGLVLANVLHRNGVQVAVYDLDASPTARDQGGMLDMHEDSGQLALRAAGVFEQFQASVLPSGEAMRLLDSSGAVHLADDGEGGSRPEVSRKALRAMLSDALPDGVIHWGAKVTGIAALGGGAHRVGFADGSTVDTELLVGADGAWSKVRPLVSAAVPAYTGMSFVEFQLADADARHPQAAALIGSGSMFALAHRKGMLAHRCSDGSLDIGAALTVPLEWLDTVDTTDIAATAAMVRAEFAGWAPEMLALVATSDRPIALRPIHALPVGHRWDRVPGVTLLGDAAHVMSPFAGEGANLAMLDGAELAAAILAHHNDIETGLAAYEREMSARAAISAQESADNLVRMFREDAPQPLVDLFAAMQAGIGA